MDKTSISDQIKKTYNAIVQDLEGQATEHSAFALLISLEQSIKDYLEGQLKKNLFEALSGQLPLAPGRREKIEKIVLSQIMGQETENITELLDRYIKYLDSIIKSDKPFDEKIEELKVYLITISDVILPPDPELAPETGSGAGREKREGQDYDRLNTILGIFTEMHIAPSEYLIIKGGVAKGRRLPYYAIIIPKLSKTIFICNEYSQATYIYDGVFDKNGLAKPMKGLLQSLGVEPIKFFAGDIQGWREEVKNYLSASPVVPGESVKVLYDKNRKLIKDQDEIIELIEGKRSEWLSLNTGTRLSWKLEDEDGKEIISYVLLCRLFGFTDKIPSLGKNIVFKELTKRLFGENIRDKVERIKNINVLRERNKMIDLIRGQKEEWLTLNTGTRLSWKLEDEDGEIISYVALCRLFGFTGSGDYLKKDEPFSELTEKLFGKSYLECIKELMQGKRNEFLNLNFNGRASWNLKNHNGRYIIGYINFCYLFGFKGDMPYLATDEVFRELSKKVFGEDIWQRVESVQERRRVRYQEKIMALIRQEREERLRLDTTRKRTSWSLKNEAGEIIISYINLCRLFGFEEKAHLLDRDDIFNKLTNKLLE